MAALKNVVVGDGNLYRSRGFFISRLTYLSGPWGDFEKWNSVLNCQLDRYVHLWIDGDDGGGVVGTAFVAARTVAVVVVAAV